MTFMVSCPTCGHQEKIDKKQFDLMRQAGIPMRCGHCDMPISLANPNPSKRSGALLKRSKLQEKKAAKRLGGRVQAGSGNQPGLKGDVRRQGEVRLECKLTTAKSYQLKLADLMKIEAAAYSGEKPAFEIEFQGVHPVRRYVVLPGWVYDYYAGLAGDQE